MSTRFPTPSPQDLNPSQLTVTRDATALVRETFGTNFELHDSQGELLGPFAPLTYTPTTFIPWLQYGHSVVTMPQVSARERELATLAVCSTTHAEFILYAHKRISLSLGLSKKQVEAAAEGKMPQSLNEQESVVYEIGLGIARGLGKLESEQWEKGDKVLGKEKMAALLQIVGWYLLSSVLVNGAESPTPPDT
jgi:4-carboxymuconolactone decarboxylase